jgi:prenyltransferase beta subunit
VITPADASGLFTPPVNRLQTLTGYVKTHTYGIEGEFALSSELQFPSFEGAFYALGIYEIINAPGIDPSINMSHHYRWLASMQARPTFAPGHGGFTLDITTVAGLSNTHFSAVALETGNQLHRINTTALGVWVDQVHVNNTPTWGWTNTSQPTIVSTSLVVEILDIANALTNISNESALIDWILDCQNSTGGFGIRANDTSPSLMTTYYAVSALDRLGELDSLDEAAIRDYVLNHQLPDGGFATVGSDPDLASTYWALETLLLVSNLSSVTNTTGISQWIIGLQQTDGGFSRLPGESSSYLASSFYAVSILYTLDLSIGLTSWVPWDTFNLSVPEILFITLAVILVLGIILLVRRIQQID